MHVQGRQGFTLLELATVLAIIGLLMGAILAGQELILGATIKSAITQIQKYQSAAGVFQEKFSALPGDMPSALATKYGFTSRAGGAGKGDGNNLIDGNAGLGSLLQGGGETGLFWVDLTSANGLNLYLVDGAFNAATDSSTPNVTSTGIAAYMPQASIGRGNYIYVYENNGTNYFGLSVVLGLSAGVVSSAPNLPVNLAYKIDQKIDDGLPMLGTVIATYIDQGAVYWAAGGGGYGGGQIGSGNTSATPATPITCYDNNNTAGAIQKYSITTQHGSGANCALSFAF